MTTTPATTSEMDQLDQLGAKAFDLGILAKGRAAFTTDEWRDFLIRSIGLEPTALDQRAKMVVLGPRGTGKSHLFEQILPYSH
jgi:ATP-dependent Lon protease